MLSTREIREHLERLTYKPSWQFECYDGRWEGQHFVIFATLPDSEKPEETTLAIHSMLPPMGDTDALEDWLAWRLARIEIHEMREWLKRDGQVIFDPHAEGADRDEE